MTHATPSLLTAMRGEGSPDSPQLSDLMNACDGKNVGEAHFASTRDVRDGKPPIDCPACLRLMRDARGPDWDVVESRRAEAEQAKYDAEREAEAAARRKTA